MIQICYASRATSEQPQLLNDLRNILSEAHDFNTLHGITGVLYYADGYFFQCLEGEVQNLDKLLAKLHLDSRHYQIKLFESRSILKASFSGWSMKFVGRNSIIQQYFVSLGYSYFNPNQLSQEEMYHLIDYLTDAQSSKTQSSEIC